MASPKRTRRLAFIVFAVLIALALVFTWFNMQSTDAADDEADAPSPTQQEDPGTSALSQEDAAPVTYAAYGASVAAGEAVPVEALAAQPEAYLSETVTVAGAARSVCQKKGCWVVLGAAPAVVRVHVPRTEEGYDFTLPMTLAGERIVAKGVLTEKTLAAETQDHYAQEAGDTSRAAAPATELQLAARGVLVAEMP